MIKRWLDELLTAGEEWTACLAVILEAVDALFEEVDFVEAVAAGAAHNEETVVACF